MPVNNIIEPIKTFIATYTGLTAGAPLTVDSMGGEAVQYSIQPLPGDRIVEEYIDGSCVCEYPFAFRSIMSTAAEADRIANNGFYEDFAQWMKTQTLAGTLPTMETDKTAEKIEAIGWGFIETEGESDTAIYQITCKLTYKQQP